MAERAVESGAVGTSTIRDRSCLQNLYVSRGATGNITNRARRISSSIQPRPSSANRVTAPLASDSLCVSRANRAVGDNRARFWTDDFWLCTFLNTAITTSSKRPRLKSLSLCLSPFSTHRRNIGSAPGTLPMSL